MRQNHKDVSWIVNPTLIKLNDGREFNFITSTKDDLYYVQLFNAKTGEEYPQFRAQFENGDEIYDYIDLMLSEKALHKAK